MPLGAVMQNVQVSASIHAIEGKVDLVKREMESVNDYINRFKLHFEELFKKPDVPVEFQSFKSFVESFIKDTQDKYVTTISTISGIRSSLETVKITTNTHDTEISMFRRAFPIIDKKIDDTKEELSSKIVSISSAFNNRFDEHAEKQKKQLEMFGSQAMSAPNSVIESNKQLLDKIEVACIDGANALLKSSNVEMSVKLLERKLENLTLQVKKIELSQQE